MMVLVLSFEVAAWKEEVDVETAGRLHLGRGEEL